LIPDALYDSVPVPGRDCPAVTLSQVSGAQTAAVGGHSETPAEDSAPALVRSATPAVWVLMAQSGMADRSAVGSMRSPAVETVAGAALQAVDSDGEAVGSTERIGRGLVIPVCLMEVLLG